MNHSLIVLVVYSEEPERFFRLEIKNLHNRFTLSLKVLDKIVDKEIYYHNVNELLELMFQTENKYSKRSIYSMCKELDKKHKRYNYFDFAFDKNKNVAYSALINAVKNYQLEQPKGKDEEYMIILDGYSVSLEIIENNKTRKFEVRTPTQKTHPILTGLITDSLDIFRENKIISTDKNFTVGF